MDILYQQRLDLELVRIGNVEQDGQIEPSAAQSLL
jgi:hypothetical protein